MSQAIFVSGRLRVAPGVRAAAIAVTLLFVGLFLVVPLLAVFVEAFRAGWRFYVEAVTSEESLHAVYMTVLVAVFAVPLNTVFGVAAAWAVTKFDFRGKGFLLTLIDLPFSVSPVIAGMIFVILFGRKSPMGHWLEGHGVQIIFALPGMVLATIFVTFPFVARELIPLMQEQGSQEEQAAISLGASGWQTFWRITLPNIKWGLLYGVILCNARAMGEFGAVSVLAENFNDKTIPLQVDVDYNSNSVPKAFALATLLAMLGLLTLLAKAFLEWRIQRQRKQSQARAEGDGLAEILGEGI